MEREKGSSSGEHPSKEKANVRGRSGKKRGGQTGVTGGDTVRPGLGDEDAQAGSKKNCHTKWDRIGTLRKTKTLSRFKKGLNFGRTQERKGFPKNSQVWKTLGVLPFGRGGAGGTHCQVKQQINGSNTSRRKRWVKCKWITNKSDCVARETGGCTPKKMRPKRF